MPTNETSYTILRSLPDGTTIEVEPGADYDDDVAAIVGDGESSELLVDQGDGTVAPTDVENTVVVDDKRDTPPEEPPTEPGPEPVTAAPSAPEAQE